MHFPAVETKRFSTRGVTLLCRLAPPLPRGLDAELLEVVPRGDVHVDGAGAARVHHQLGSDPDVKLAEDRSSSACSAVGARARAREVGARAQAKKQGSNGKQSYAFQYEIFKPRTFKPGSACTAPPRSRAPAPGPVATPRSGHLARNNVSHEESWQRTQEARHFGAAATRRAKMPLVQRRWML